MSARDRLTIVRPAIVIETFWPAWSELKAGLDRHVRRRRALRDVIAKTLANRVREG